MRNDRGNDAALPGGSLAVAVDFPDPGVGQSLVARKHLPSRLHFAHITYLFRQILRFLLRQIHLHAPQGIDDGNEGIEADLNGVIHMDAKILLDALGQHLHAAERRPLPLASQGVAHVDPVPASGVTGVGGQGNVEIPHEGHHAQGLGLPVDGAQNHGVCQHVGLVLPVVVAYQHDVCDVLIGVNLRPGVLGTGFPGFLGGSQQRLQLLQR